MADYTVADIKNDVSRLIHGASINKVKDFTGVVNQAAREMLMYTDPPETKTSAQIANALYDDVLRYSSPTDLKGKKVIDIRPQVGRSLNDNFTRFGAEEFDLKKKNNTFEIEHDNGNKFIRLSKQLTSGTELHTMDDVSTNGSWAVGGDAQNLTQDTQFKVSGNASLNVDLDGSTTSGYIENSTLTSVDLSEHEDVSALFVWVYFPDSSIITNINLRWGSSASAYWHRTVTAPHDDTSFRNGWNLLRFDWNGASETGSPDSSDITYSRVTITYNGTAETDIRIDNIVSRIGKIWEMVYYSKFLFRDSSDTWKEQASSNDDKVNLDTETYNMLLHEIMVIVHQQLQGEDSQFDSQLARSDRDQFRTYYTQLYPSEAITRQTTYYRMPVRGRTSKFGGSDFHSGSFSG